MSQLANIPPPRITIIILIWIIVNICAVALMNTTPLLVINLNLSKHSSLYILIVMNNNNMIWYILYMSLIYDYILNIVIADRFSAGAEQNRSAHREWSDTHAERRWLEAGSCDLDSMARLPLPHGELTYPTACACARACTYANDLTWCYELINSVTTHAA